jgi:uncharacterized protein (TIGR03435 family)
MMRALLAPVLLVWSVYAADAQPAFEAASVKTVDPSVALAPGVFTGVQLLPSGRLLALRVTVFQLLQTIYDVKAFQISGGPAWLKSQWYEIQATAGAPASEEQIKLMAQALLADRFQLRLHRETRQIPVYALIPGKNGPKMQTAKDPTQCGGNGCFGVGNGNLSASGATMAFFAGEVLTRLLDRPALDKTGLSGNHYDFKLTYDQSSIKPPIAGMQMTPTEGPSIFAAVEDLGLKLNPEKDPIEFLVIDSVEHPGAN